MTTIEKVKSRAESDARTYGYYLNPDPDFLNDLLEGLKQNEEKYGYPSCPCRLASGKLEFDRDVICPCDYRDPDVLEHGACYCALYVRKDVYEGKTPTKPVPERRPSELAERAQGAVSEIEKANGQVAPDLPTKPAGTEMKLWYCKQCGYVCFRENPPYICPVCKAKKELFAEITLYVGTRS